MLGMFKAIFVYCLPGVLWRNGGGWLFGDYASMGGHPDMAFQGMNGLLHGAGHPGFGVVRMMGSRMGRHGVLDSGSFCRSLRCTIRSSVADGRLRDNWVRPRGMFARYIHHSVNHLDGLVARRRWVCRRMGREQFTRYGIVAFAV